MPGEKRETKVTLSLGVLIAIAIATLGGVGSAVGLGQWVGGSQSDIQSVKKQQVELREALEDARQRFEAFLAEQREFNQTVASAVEKLTERSLGITASLDRHEKDLSSHTNQITAMREAIARLETRTEAD